MNKKNFLFMLPIFVLILIGFLGVASAQTTLTLTQYNNAKSAIISAADRLVALQDSSGSWDWIVTDDVSSQGENNYNLAGVTAEGLLDAYKLTGNVSYLNAAKISGDYIVSVPISITLGQNSASILFLYHLYSVTRDITYQDKANAIMNSLLHDSNKFSVFDTDGTLGLSAHELLLAYEDYRNYWPGEQNGIVTWDLYQYVEDAKLYGDNAFASNMANEIKTYLDKPTYTGSVHYYALGLSSGIEALNLQGMDYTSYLADLSGVQNPNSSFGTLDEGQVQTTSYSIIALASISNIASELTYLINGFGYTDLSGSYNGWMETDGSEYAESDSEAIQAIYSIISHTSLDLSPTSNPDGTTKSSAISSTLNLNSHDTDNIQVEIPTGTISTGNLSWDGTINAPTILETTTVPPFTQGFTSVVGKVVEVGFAGIKLTFDKAVKIVIPGEGGTGHFVGYVSDGTFNPISLNCPSDDQTWASNNLNSSVGECYFSEGSNLIIWTKHFTQFVTYTQIPTPAPQVEHSTVSGGGGGGGGASSTANNNAVNTPINTTNNPSTAAGTNTQTNPITGAATNNGAPITGGVIGTITSSPWAMAGIIVFVLLIVTLVLVSKRKSKFAQPPK